MMDWTDRHCRYFMRLLSPSAFLYTEMVTAAAITHGDSASLLRFDETAQEFITVLIIYANSRLDGNRHIDRVLH